MTIKKIINYLDEIIPNPHCELKYNKDYELLIATMLSAQTTDKRVNQVTNILFEKYSTLTLLSNAKQQDIIEIIKPLGTFQKKSFNVIKIAQTLKTIGYVPNNRDFLQQLPGVGRKTANVVLSVLYNEPCIAVDTHVTRVSIRLGLAKENDNAYTIEKNLTQKFKHTNLCRIHHQLVLFGRYYCKAKKPLCENCKLKTICKYQNFSTHS